MNHFIDLTSVTLTLMMEQEGDESAGERSNLLQHQDTQECFEVDRDAEPDDECKKDGMPLSRHKQWIMMLSVGLLWMLVLIVETIIFPFYPAIAKKKGISKIWIGAVFTAYELTRVAANPIFGSLVSKL